MDNPNHIETSVMWAALVTGIASVWTFVLKVLSDFRKDKEACDQERQLLREEYEDKFSELREEYDFKLEAIELRYHSRGARYCDNVECANHNHTLKGK